MEINERIFYLLKEQNKTAKDLGEYIGVKPSSISAWKNKGSYPSSKYLVRISEFFNVSLQYLLTGQDERIQAVSNLSTEETELIEAWRELDYESKVILKGKLFDLRREQRSSSEDGEILERKAT